LKFVYEVRAKTVDGGWKNIKNPEAYSRPGNIISGLGASQ
jgi:hypothetical protein